MKELYEIAYRPRANPCSKPRVAIVLALNVGIALEMIEAELGYHIVIISYCMASSVNLLRT